MAEHRSDGDRDGKPHGGEAIGEDLRGLIGAATRLASAELAYQTLRVRLIGKAAMRGAITGALAAMLLFFTLMALVVGLLLALARSLGAWAALGAVAGGFLLAALIAALVCMASVRRIRKLLRDGKG